MFPCIWIFATALLLLLLKDGCSKIWRVHHRQNRPVETQSAENVPLSLLVCVYHVENDPVHGVCKRAFRETVTFLTFIWSQSIDRRIVWSELCATNHFDFWLLCYQGQPILSLFKLNNIAIEYIWFSFFRQAFFFLLLFTTYNRKLRLIILKNGLIVTKYRKILCEKSPAKFFIWSTLSFFFLAELTKIFIFFWDSHFSFILNNFQISWDQHQLIKKTKITKLSCSKWKISFSYVMCVCSFFLISTIFTIK